MRAFSSTANNTHSPTSTSLFFLPKLLPPLPLSCFLSGKWNLLFVRPSLPPSLPPPAGMAPLLASVEQSSEGVGVKKSVDPGVGRKGGA